MPEIYFEVRWPSGETTDCYSPSSVVRDYLEDNQSLTVDDFVRISEKALSQASERVRDKYGYRCSNATDQRGAESRTSTDFDRLENAIDVDNNRKLGSKESSRYRQRTDTTSIPGWTPARRNRCPDSR